MLSFFSFLQFVMNVETLLEAARYLELQEQRERLTSTSSSASSVSTSPYSNSRYNQSQNYASQQSLASTPPASPLSDGPRSLNDYATTNGTIIRSGKLSIKLFYFSVSNKMQRKTLEYHQSLTNVLRFVWLFYLLVQWCFEKKRNNFHTLHRNE